MSFISKSLPQLPPNHYEYSLPEQTSADYDEQARQLLRDLRARTREADGHSSGAQSWRRKAVDIYKYGEVNEVLAGVVLSGGPVGVVKALLRLDSDVNFVIRKSRNVFKKALHAVQRDKQEQRSDLLWRATSSCRVEIVGALASKADQTNLDGALGPAITRGDVDILQVLLLHGADPVHLHTEFEDLVSRKQLDLLRALLSGPHRPCLPCRSTGLRIAIEHDHRETLHMMLEAGADVNHQDGIALQVAVRATRLDFVLALLSKSNVPVSPANLDAATGVAYGAIEAQVQKDVASSGSQTSQHACTLNTRTIGDLISIIDICLAKGALGTNMDIILTQGFTEVIQWRQVHLLEIMLKYGKPKRDYQTKALLAAMNTQQKEVFIRLLQLQPSKEALTAAASQVTEITDPTLQYQFAEILVRSGARASILGDALIRIVGQLCSQRQTPSTQHIEQTATTHLFNLFLDTGQANLDHATGEALQLAVKASRLDLAEQIVAKGLSPESLGAALPYAMRLDNVQDKHSIIKMLLQRPVSQHAVDKALLEALKVRKSSRTLVYLLLSQASVDQNNGEPLKHAVQKSDIEVLRLLLRRGPNAFSLSTALSESLKLPSFNGPEPATRSAVCHELLPYLNQDHLDNALLKVSLEPNPELTLISKLLEAGASADSDKSKAVASAASRGHVKLLGKLLGDGEGASGYSSTVGLVHAIITHHDEALLLKLISVIQENSKALDPNQTLEAGMPPPIILCLNLYNSVNLLERLITIGCSLEKHTPCPAQTSTTCTVMVLEWALRQPETKISHQVIDCIIRHGVNVNLHKTQTGMTPLMLAANGRRVETVKSLLAAGAQISAKDSCHHSALFYASSSGNANLVSCLLEHKPLTNDGSLHEASRCFDTDTMKLLINAGHSVNYRSKVHGYRSALGEMALRGRLPREILQAEIAVTFLKEVGADPLIKVDDKSVILLLFDNQDPVPVAEVLVDRLLFDTMNAEENMFRDRHGYHYSPTMYLSHRLADCPASAIDHLLRILKRHNARDRLYADKGQPQPSGAKGLPGDIEAYESRRRQREESLFEKKEDAIADFMLQSAVSELDHSLIEKKTDHAIQTEQRRRRAGFNLDLEGANMQGYIARQRHDEEQTMLEQQRQGTLSFADAQRTQQRQQSELSARQAMALKYDWHAQGMLQDQQRHDQSNSQKWDGLTLEYEVSQQRLAQDYYDNEQKHWYLGTVNYYSEEEHQRQIAVGEQRKQILGAEAFLQHPAGPPEWITNQEPRMIEYS